VALRTWVPPRFLTLASIYADSSEHEVMGFGRLDISKPDWFYVLWGLTGFIASFPNLKDTWDIVGSSINLERILFESLFMNTMKVWWKHI
jgi:hypothetical protein